MFWRVILVSRTPLQSEAILVSCVIFIQKGPHFLSISSLRLFFWSSHPFFMILGPFRCFLGRLPARGSLRGITDHVFLCVGHNEHLFAKRSSSFISHTGSLLYFGFCLSLWCTVFPFFFRQFLLSRFQPPNGKLIFVTKACNRITGVCSSVNHHKTYEIV